MKSRFLIRLLLASLLLRFVPFACTVGFAQPGAFVAGPAVVSTGRLLRFEADSAHGFNFPYLIYIPAGTPLRDTLFLLVEPNNTGFVNDTLAVHERAARYVAGVSSVGNSVAKALHIPLLVPVFPRPARDSLTYTHAFDRDAALIRRGRLQRLDLQLLAMIDDARRQLDTLDITLREKVLLNGFSASGTFVNRLTVIHPDRVAATACGGINAMPILPVTALHNVKLPYPLGLHDFELFFGKAFDWDAYRQVPQFLYMGERDDNDAVLYDDAYSEEERHTVFSVIGKIMLPDRWGTGAAAYQAARTKAVFKTYPGIGHGTDGHINAEVARFFRTVLPTTTGTVSRKVLKE